MRSTTVSLPMTPPGKNLTFTRPCVCVCVSAAAARSSFIQPEPSGAMVAILMVCCAATGALIAAASARHRNRLSQEFIRNNPFR